MLIAYVCRRRETYRKTISQQSRCNSHINIKLLLALSTVFLKLEVMFRFIKQRHNLIIYFQIIINIFFYLNLLKFHLAMDIINLKIQNDLNSVIWIRKEV